MTLFFLGVMGLFPSNPLWAGVQIHCEGESCGGGGEFPPILPPYPGWPKPAGSGHPVTADLDGNGTLEVLLTAGNRIYVFRENGTLLWQRNLSGYTAGSPVVAELNPLHPGLELVVTSGGESSGGSTWGNIYVVHSDDGSDAPGWPINAQGFAYTPALADFDGDGVQEIVVGVRRGHSNALLYLLRANGAPFSPGWNGDLGAYGVPLYAIADLDRYGTPEIVLALNRNVYVYHADGTVMPGWPKDLGDSADSWPALGDLDGDGDLEIAIGKNGGPPPYYGEIAVFHHTGFPVQGWPQPVRNYMGSPAIGNLDNTGTSEVVIGDGAGYVHVFHADGTIASGWPKLLSNYATEAVFADLDGNGTREIVVGSANRNVYAFHANGNLVSGFPVTSGSAMYHSAAVADLNGDGRLELLVAPGNVSIWTLPWNGAERFPWPMFRKDERRTGSDPPPSLTP